MATQVRMPQLSLTMAEGTIGKWLKQPGETVEQGEPLYEVETDKVINEVESPASGVLREIIVPEGASAPVQGLLAIIEEPGEARSADEGRAEPTAPPKLEADAPAPPPAATGEAAPGERLFASPRARKVAAEQGIDLLALRGSGPGGRIMEKDVDRAIAARLSVSAVAAADLAARAVAASAAVAPSRPAEARPAPAGAPPLAAPAAGGHRAVRLAGMRRTIAERMSRSQAATAHVTLTAEVDMGEAAKLREQATAEWQKAGLGRLTYTDVVVKAVARALRAHPRLNATLVDGEVRELSAVSVGVAVALDEGLIVPVIRNADQKALLEISAAVRDLSTRARAGSLSADEVTGGTFTVTNMGMLGVEVFTPIINAPECAILGVGRVADRAVVRGGQVAVRPTAWLSLTFDHRIVDGAPAAAFLGRVKELLESPYLLFV